MRFIQKFLRVIPVNDIDDLYKTPSEVALRLLKKEFEPEGKCIDGVLLLSIKEITYCSDITIVTMTNSGRGTLTVQFLAECERYESGEIIPSFMVTKYADDLVMGNIPGRNVTVTITTKSPSYSVGSTGIAIVLTAEYITSDAVVIKALPFQATLRQVMAYNMRGDISPHKMKLLQARAGLIREARAELAALDQKQIKAMQQVLYVKADKPKAPSGGDFEVVDVCDFVDKLSEAKVGCIVKPIELGYASTEICVSPSKYADASKLPKDIAASLTPTLAVQVREENIVICLLRIFDLIDIELSSLIEMVKTYDINTFRSKEIFFKLYTASKRPSK